MKFYIVREDILPDSILKTAEVKELLASGKKANVSEAVEEVGLARSTFYKYKDGVFSFFNADNLEIINISLSLKHEAGVLSRVLNNIASNGGNVLTINQSLPLHGIAGVTISINIVDLVFSLEDLIIKLKQLDGVNNVEIIGKS